MHKELVERRLTTILAADVVGYSRLMAADETATLASLKAFQSEIFDPKTTEHRGRVVKLMGDGILMEFASVVDAVSFAVDVQDAIASRNATSPDQQHLTYRIGINIGDVIIDGDDIFGDGVNVAARIEAMADPGGISVSRTVYDHVKGKVPFEFEDLGAQKVKNIPDPVQILKVLSGASEKNKLQTRKKGKLPFRLTIIGLVSVAVLALLTMGIWLQPWKPRLDVAVESDMAFPLPDRPSIAVLPFDDLSEQGSQAFFADGLTEDLITDLSKISGLFVIARNSTFVFKGKAVNIKEVAESLGVRYVLEGSVRRAGDQLRVNAQLIDATTGGHVWADRFDGNITDLFTIQDQFVMKIVSALELELSDNEMIALTETETEKLLAKEAFQRGWNLYSRFNEQDNARSVRHFEKAIELDPEYGRAYGALALVYLRGSIFLWNEAMGVSSSRLYYEYVPKYLIKAKEYNTALVHVVQAMQYLYYRDGPEPEGSNRGTDDARIEAGRAIALQPSDPEAHITMAWALIAAGKPKDGLNFVQAAMRLNPNYPSHYVFFQAIAYYGLGDLEQAASIVRQGLERDPQAVELAPLAASLFALLGQRQEAALAIDMWRLGETEAQQQQAAAAYFFPIRWVFEKGILNLRLVDGLRLAALPGDTTVASLLAGLVGQPPDAQTQSIRILGWFGSTASPAVPELIRLLASPEKLVRREATITLGKIGPDARAAIPALKATTDLPIIGFHAKAAIANIESD